MESNLITFIDLLRLVKKNTSPQYIKFMDEVYEYYDGNYYSQLTRSGLDEIINKYPTVLTWEEKVIEIL